MMSDAISHTVLLGIVLAFFIVEDLGHPLLVVGATLVGVHTVMLTELLKNTRLVKEDAAIGLVFPALFSMAVLLISLFARNVRVHSQVDQRESGAVATDGLRSARRLRVHERGEHPRVDGKLRGVSYDCLRVGFEISPWHVRRTELRESVRKLRRSDVRRRGWLVGPLGQVVQTDTARPQAESPHLVRRERHPSIVSSGTC